MPSFCLILYTFTGQKCYKLADDDTGMSTINEKFLNLVLDENQKANVQNVKKYFNGYVKEILKISHTKKSVATLRWSNESNAILVHDARAEKQKLKPDIIYSNLHTKFSGQDKSRTTGEATTKPTTTTTATVICEVCDLELSDKASLSRHTKSKHSDERPFQCSVVGCGFSFKRKDNLDNHVVAKHKETKISGYCSAEGCDYAIKIPGNYKIHKNKWCKKR